MLFNIFDSIFGNENQQTISIQIFLLCILITLIEGLIYYFAYTFKNKVSTSFKISLFFLPTVVNVVIMMVSGNIGIGVAIAGAFSLIRFRSNQGSAKEIVIIFMTMCSGLICGVGYLFYSGLFTLIMCLLILIINLIINKYENKILKITLPEDLNYNQVFTDLLNKYTFKYELINVKTSNMGSLYKLKYKIVLKNNISEKEFIDELRTRNGNLEISILQEENENEL